MCCATATTAELAKRMASAFARATWLASGSRLRQLTRPGQAHRCANHQQRRAQHTAPPLLEPAAQARTARMRALEASGIFRDLEGASPHLQSRVRSEVMRREGEPTEDDVWAVLTEIVELRPVRSRRRPHPSRGATEGVSGLPRPPPPGRRARRAVGRKAGLEEKQCVVLSLVGAVLWAERGTPPTIAEVQARALEERAGLWDQAAEASGALGPMPARLGRTEADLRLFAHDAASPHHDTDFRNLTAFPLRLPADKILHVLLVDYRGKLQERWLWGLRPTATRSAGLAGDLGDTRPRLSSAHTLGRPVRRRGLSSGGAHAQGARARGCQAFLEEASEEEPTESGRGRARCARCRADVQFATAMRRAGGHMLLNCPQLEWLVYCGVWQHLQTTRAPAPPEDTRGGQVQTGANVDCWPWPAVVAATPSDGGKRCL